MQRCRSGSLNSPANFGQRVRNRQPLGGSAGLGTVLAVLPADTAPGDLVVIPATGAYGRSMALRRRAAETSRSFRLLFWDARRRRMKACSAPIRSRAMSTPIA